MQDDIDWLNASSDFGLVRLCREMAGIAKPVEAIISLAPRYRARRKSLRTQTQSPRMTEARASATV